MNVNIVNATLLVCPNASVTFTVNVEEAAVVGVPEMMPVEELSERPAGREPLVTLQVYGAAATCDPSWPLRLKPVLREYCSVVEYD